MNFEDKIKNSPPEQRKNTAELIQLAYWLLKREGGNIGNALLACAEAGDEYEAMTGEPFFGVNQKILANAIALVKHHPEQANELLAVCDSEAEPLPIEPEINMTPEQFRAGVTRYSTPETKAAIVEAFMLASQLLDDTEGDYPEALLRSGSVGMEYNENGLPYFGTRQNTIAAALDMLRYNPDAAEELIHLCMKPTTQPSAERNDTRQHNERAEQQHHTQTPSGTTATGASPKREAKQQNNSGTAQEQR